MSHPSALVNCLTGIRSKQPWLVLKSAELFSLSESANPDISHFYGFEAKDSGEATFAIPDGCVDILFDCDASEPSAKVYGTPVSASQIDLQRRHRYFGVRFASGVMPDCMNVAAKELIDHNYSFVELISDANQLFERIVTSSSFHRQAALLDAFFDSRKMRKHSALTSQVLQHIVQSKGRLHISELEDSTGFTTRTIERRFLADMGMSPKAFCRIIRCQSAVYDINHSEQIRFSELAVDLGFSDQSHFSREFKKHVNTTPLDYLKRVRHSSYLERIQQKRPLNAH